MMSQSGPDKTLSLFNGPVESGVRAVVVLAHTYPRKLDLQRLVYFDYLLIHSGDFERGPESIHPPTPNRSGEVLIRRSLVEKGLLLMLSRGLVIRTATGDGLLYQASERAASFLKSVESDYMLKLRQRGRWVASAFGDMEMAHLREVFRSHVRNWDGEFLWTSADEEDIE